ncbi:ATP-dependent DNA helicase [Demequina sediminicola]|uniref:ATP-dependent DNA helicase n=1 Tax=Demequina sediminicola TaxID=1095026 RepID=UPI000782ADE7|nr:ATP-dependent DNA helicase [Demequina sediminicola]
MSDDGVVLGQARSVAELAALINPDAPPTPEQEAIIGAGLEPTLVVAGAGSGKTETLSMRMVYLLDHAEELCGRPISPDEILCLTFTRKAAAEISERSAERFRAVFGDDPARPPASVATYNGYSAALVAEHGLRLGVDPESVTLTDAALWQIAHDIVSHWTEPVNVASAQSTLTSAIVQLSSQLREHLVTPAQARTWATGLLTDLGAMPSKTGTALETRTGTPTAEAKDLAQVARLAELMPMVEEFQRRKRLGAYLDFSDQVAYGVQLADVEAVQAIERSRYRVVLLDEFQDTSPAQLQLFARIFGQDHPVMAVGDPNQAIYGFRGASASALSSFVDLFGGPDIVRSRTLSVSWRNEAAILAAANGVASALPVHPKVTVEPLKSKGQFLGTPEPSRVAPAVQSMMATDIPDEAASVVEYIQRRSAELGQHRGRSRPVTAAILCRRRAQFPAIVAALTAAGVDHEVVGLGGLIDTPEVAELIALLQVVHDPSRGDSLMRLLTGERVALGPGDLMALKDWAMRDARRDDDEAVTIVDALDDLPDPEWVSQQGRQLTAVARRRLESLHTVVRSIREHSYLTLTELIIFAERAWGLDIEAAVAHPDGRSTRNVDAFVDAARGFAAGAERATLGAFLSWLTAAANEERGLTAPVKEPEPGAVQVLTCHSAKGLEWDVVAVPGLTEGTGRSSRSQFPSGGVPKFTDEGECQVNDSGWLSGAGNLPYPLRLDKEDLPLWDLSEVHDRPSLRASIDAFRAEAGLHRVDEERRLFYVALTRARSHVLLSGSWWTSGKALARPSLFLRECIEAGLVDTDGWSPQPEPDAERVVPPPTEQWWPAPATAEQERRRVLAAEVVKALDSPEALAGVVDPSLPWATEAEAFLVERDLQRGSGPEVTIPAHLTTSALVALQRDRDAYAQQLRRPVPQEPTVAAEVGNAFHAWVEAHYGRSALFTLDDLDGDAVAMTSPDLDRLKEAFAESEWFGRAPSDIEVAVELPMGGVTIRSRIDAVFPPGRGLDKVTVVDWKSGRPPRDDAERAAREVQLAVYRLAWSEWKSIPVEDVDAAFYYAGANQTVRPERLLSRQELVALVRGEDSQMWDRS